MFCDVARLRSFSKAAAANECRSRRSARSSTSWRIAWASSSSTARPAAAADPAGQGLLRGLQAAGRAVRWSWRRPSGTRTRRDRRHGAGGRHLLRRPRRHGRSTSSASRPQQPHAQVHLDTCTPTGSTRRSWTARPTSAWCRSPAVARADRPALARGGDGPGLLARPPAGRNLAVSPPRSWHGEKFVGFDKDLVIRREVDRFLREQGRDGRGRPGVRQHREHQEGRRDRRRRGPAARADAPPGSRGRHAASPCRWTAAGWCGRWASSTAATTS